VRILPYGEHALLVELPDLDTVHRLYAALCDELPRGVADLVPAARTLLVILDPDVAADTSAITAALQAARPAQVRDSETAVVDVPVVYDGDDLEEVAQLVRLSPEQVIERHYTPEYVVGFCGFLPGFAYLLGLDPRLHLPRRATPRVSVPPGAVAVAGEYTAAYPRSAPGGWHLLGRTNRVLFDLKEEPPALLAPRTRVRFYPVPA
jgi:KipI family sensor histidine kinase inhibitor